MVSNSRVAHYRTLELLGQLQGITQVIPRPMGYKNQVCGQELIQGEGES